MPNTRKVVKKYFLEISFDEVKYFIYSQYHEYRLFAILVLVEQYKSKKFNEPHREKIFNFYLEHLEQINNWDLVDVSCHHILGNYLINRDKNILYKMANSNNLWHRRISIISTFAFINLNKFDDAFAIADILLCDLLVRR